ncbi:uncharacterized protein LOC120919072 isoform X2 [Rana temporaria]|uniref:uncharacterized protein LOC120919072 isoform X2 n=1 Tax=Rana temporaria TaxID=8407 RepID=UPI001AAC674E|nr:uncharacterized protein LOC120919072 isoform X2 [Rana temporaria]
MKVKSSPPPGAVYSLLLLAHITLAVTANTTVTAGVNPGTLQGPVTQSVPQSVTQSVTHTALTHRHTDATSTHIPAISKVLGSSAVPTEMITVSQTDHHTDMHKEVSPGHRTTVLETFFHTVRHSTSVNEHHSTGSHSTATKKKFELVLEKMHRVPITMEHSTLATEHHPTGIHATVTTKKEHQSVPEKTNAAHITKSISVPNVRVEIGNGFQITCFSESGPEVINYELIQGDRIVKNMTVHGRKAATFQFDITPGPSKIYCRARTLSGEEETSGPLKIEGDNPDSEDKPGDRKKSDKEEWDAAPKFLISFTHILTSVSQPVQDLNAIIISVCGPILLILLLLVFLTHFCNRRGRKAGSTYV